MPKIEHLIAKLYTPDGTEVAAFMVPVKDFESGSQGYWGGGKFALPYHEDTTQRPEHQVGLSITRIHSQHEPGAEERGRKAKEAKEAKKAKASTVTSPTIETPPTPDTPPAPKVGPKPGERKGVPLKKK